MYYRQPRYFGDFKCVGGTCTNSCCIGWRIDWAKDEIDKVTSAPECSEELRELVNKSFTKPDGMEKYVVALGEEHAVRSLRRTTSAKYSVSLVRNIFRIPARSIRGTT